MHAGLPQARRSRRRHPAIQTHRRSRLGKIRPLALGWKMKSAASTPPYTLNHPRWYRKRVSTYWWLQRWEYLRFVLREISSVFVAPFVVALNVLSFFFVVFHSITWFDLSARAMSIRVGGKKIPGFMISGPNFVAWFVISAVIAWLLMRG